MRHYGSITIQDSDKGEICATSQIKICNSKFQTNPYLQRSWSEPPIKPTQLLIFINQDTNSLSDIRYTDTVY